MKLERLFLTILLKNWTQTRGINFIIWKENA